ncbi:cob(I)yrinic acid a,c-diamide adenosyltransferase [endosymbiont GvMRE of Glomus versiforme]|uniref:cob(I)yrinic acid a,c-diamide adenosyltransferase n=1 Tax=endosymbiont GvMRE of Glomus versiforme TaxID=2039283 RepID=UPI000EBC422B|nr:cob(I)yrinic acid a,c-diamide adenosyltransferase [endosymbiont GvMRE of Glomus versiforme]RHZ37132.1 Cob(I)yrinic acid a,c-diamide adenosyltransferase [endosymbiont GvMRE of Glomus versiforme]
MSLSTQVRKNNQNPEKNPIKQKQGYIHIYKGNGKGKTSVLNGMAIRALGYGFKVKYLRFLKNRESGEILFFQKKTEEMEIESFYHFSQKFIWDMDKQEDREILINKFKEETRKGFERLKKLLKEDNVDLIIVDEILGCIENQFISEDELVEALKNKKAHIEVALSGREPKKGIKNLESIADLISEISLKKHYFDKGVNARRGIEY